MGRITNLQNQIGQLQGVLCERNKEIAALKQQAETIDQQLKDEKKRSAELAAQVKALSESRAKAA